MLAFAVAVDAQGNLFIPDHYNHRNRLVKVTHYATDGGSSDLVAHIAKTIGLQPE